MGKKYKALGFMSGTSMDGIDVALIETDGETELKRLGGLSRAYQQETKDRILHSVSIAQKAGETEWPYKSSANTPSDILSLQQDLVSEHAALAKDFLRAKKLDPDDIELIGYHGQTLIHRPENGFTFQLGDGAALARKTAIKVVNDLRQKDMNMGGQGAPLAPIYHQCLVYHFIKEGRLKPGPHVFVNIGGVSNVSFLDDQGDIMAFDTGPGNALLDDWIKSMSGEICDWGGKQALSGIADMKLCEVFLKHPYFDLPPPKSIDRDLFAPCLASLRQTTSSIEDGAATLAAFTAGSIASSSQFFTNPPLSWIIAGGGRHNKAIIKALKAKISGELILSDALGINGDLIEAECFAYLAVRAIKNLPLSFPGTTGVKEPVSGGTIHEP